MKTKWRAFRCGCLIVAGVIAVGKPAITRAQDTAGTAATPAVISSVAITQDPQRAAIRVQGAGRLDVHAVRMQHPERLVLDFAGARLDVQKTSIPGVSAPVRSVRLGQFRPDVARVVIDLTNSAPYQIAHEGDAVVIYLDAEPNAAASPSPVTSTKKMDFEERAPRVVRASAKNTDAAAPRFTLPSELTHAGSNL